jgi:glutathione S-transferase
MYQLFYYPSKANLAPHFLLEELAAPHELRLVDFPANGHKDPEYLKLNPNGRLPVLVDGDTVLYESAAICLHLVDRHPQARLAPPPGTPERAQFYKWLVYLTNTVQPEILLYYYAARHADTPAGEESIKRNAEKRLAGMFDIIEEELVRNAQSGKGDYLLGEHYSAADAYLLMLARWTRTMARPARTLPRMGAYLQRLIARPAVQRAFAAEGLQVPFY